MLDHYPHGKKQRKYTRHPRQHHSACGATTDTNKVKGGTLVDESPSHHKKPTITRPSPEIDDALSSLPQPCPCLNTHIRVDPRRIAATAASTPEPGRVAPRTPPRRRPPRRVATHHAHRRHRWHCRRLELLEQRIHRNGVRPARDEVVRIICMLEGLDIYFEPF